MPATIVASPGTAVSVWVTWLDAPELQRMNATEGVGTLYSYGVLSGAWLDTPGPTVMRPRLYVDCFGPLRVGGRILAIRSIAARHRRLVAVDSRHAVAQVGPAVGWHRSVSSLLLDNVRFPAHRASRNRTMEALGTWQALPGFAAVQPCGRT